jgi:glycosyltransferase involved in cell wall biosynthesis
LSVRVLCLDIEGGYGGSSRSLYESIRHLPEDVKAEVWCRRPGPVQQRYAAIGVPCRVTAEMPHISSLPRLSRNVYAYARFLQRWRAARDFRRMLAEAAERFDVVHFNHEGLFLLARWLRKGIEPGRPVLTMHVRTHLPTSPFSRWQYRTIVDTVDRLVFITENEAQRTALLAGHPAPGTVIYNIVTEPAAGVRPNAELVADSRFKVIAVSNYAFIRGIDRLVDIAVELRRRGRSDILFVIAGTTTLSRSLPGELGAVARAGGDLSDYARHCGVADMFRFLGHVAEPESVVLAGDLIVKPTREHNPWGRDILEAMAAAKPVMTVGLYDRFVENGVTGIMHPEFNAGVWADEIIRLADDREQLQHLGGAAQQRALSLCDGATRARELRDVWVAAVPAEAKRPCAA